MLSLLGGIGTTCLALRTWRQRDYLTMGCWHRSTQVSRHLAQPHSLPWWLQDMRLQAVLKVEQAYNAVQNGIC